MEKRYNRNEIRTMDARYIKQQETIRKVCSALNLVVYYPEYHADKTDKNTVIIYTPEGYEYNKQLSRWASVDDEKGRVCSFQNTDINGLFDLNWMNNGTIDVRFSNGNENIEQFIKKCLVKHKG